MSGPDYPLRRRVQKLMAEGKLPRAVAIHTVSGVGTRRRCALCDDLTIAPELEVEVYVEPLPLHPFVFHRPCYLLWSVERMLRG